MKVMYTKLKILKFKNAYISQNNRNIVIVNIQEHKLAMLRICERENINSELN